MLAVGCVFLLSRRLLLLAPLGEVSRCGAYPAASAGGIHQESQEISWAEYQEDIPYPGFQGAGYTDQKTHANDYIRKHNPLILFDAIASNNTALRQIKRFTDFQDDLDKKMLPQWAFITPNMTNDGHNTNVKLGSKWLRHFVSNLMNNAYFWNDTLLLLTSDESETYTLQNRVFSILLGGAIPERLVGTTDDTMYSHYTAIASVSANWGLPSLGRWDCGANIFELVANKTGYRNWEVDTSTLLLNMSLPGPLSQLERRFFPGQCLQPPARARAVTVSFRRSLAPIRECPPYNYTAPFPHDTASGLDVGVPYSRNGTTYISGVNISSSAAKSSTSSDSASSDKAAAKMLESLMG